jgi:ribosome-associated protein
MAKPKTPEQEWEELDGRPSKTEQKKAVQRMAALGQQLADLPESQIKKLPIDDYLRISLLELKVITAHEARRRQFQLIGKLLRREDEAAIIVALSGRQSTRKQAQLVRWLERLIEQGDSAINEFVRLHPAAERHTLRQHILRMQRAIAQDFAPDEQEKLRQALLHYVQQVAILSDNS